MRDTELLIYQCVGVIIIVVASLFFSVLPISLTKINENTQRRVVSLANAVAGGVFLAGGFVHLLTEATHMVEDLGWDDLPIPSLLAVTGFLTIFFLEQVLLPKMNTTSLIHNHSNENIDIELNVVKSEKKETQTDDKDEEKQIEDTTEENIEEVEREEISNNQEETTTKKKTAFASAALVLILSSHSFFTGFTMGTQEDVTSTVTILFTILSHKWIEAFALGTTLVKNQESIPSILKLTSFYSLTLPLGVIAGAVIIFLLDAHFASVVCMIATGFGSGSFIYVAIIDILIEEFKPTTDKLAKFSFVCAGFVVISALLIAFDKD